jgi:rhodanese-related sulfurtransferase
VPTLEDALKLSDAEFKEKFGRDKPTADQEVVFHCKMGGRAGRAADTATNLGFKNVKNYKGSFNDWLVNEKK